MKTRILPFVFVGAMVMAFWAPVRSAESDEDRISKLERRIDKLEKREHVLEEIAFTYKGLQRYIHQEAKDLGGDKAEELKLAVDRAVACEEKEQDPSVHYLKVIELISLNMKATNRQKCLDECKKEYDDCKDGTAKCAGHYVLCCKGCPSK